MLYITLFFLSEIWNKSLYGVHDDITFNQLNCSAVPKVLAGLQFFCWLGHRKISFYYPHPMNRAGRQDTSCYIILWSAWWPHHFKFNGRRSCTPCLLINHEYNTHEITNSNLLSLRILYSCLDNGVVTEGKLRYANF